MNVSVKGGGEDLPPKKPLIERLEDILRAHGISQHTKEIVREVISHLRAGYTTGFPLAKIKILEDCASVAGILWRHVRTLEEVARLLRG